VKIKQNRWLFTLFILFALRKSKGKYKEDNLDSYKLKYIRLKESVQKMLMEKNVCCERNAIIAMM